MSLNWRICISSPPDREKLVAEILIENEQIAEINQESGSLEIELYPRRDGMPWGLPLNELVEALEDAKNQLQTY